MVDSLINSHHSLVERILLNRWSRCWTRCNNSERSWTESNHYPHTPLTDDVQVNVQFKEPNLTTFVCVCIPEFLSLYETERLVQELAKFEIDVHNIVINQVIFPEEDETSRLLKARVKLQQKYLEQYEDLYADFHITKLPLMEDEVRGTEKLKEFAQFLKKAYEIRTENSKHD